MNTYDDENYDDGFDDEKLAARMNLDLWRKLFVYAKQYPAELSWLALFAVITASIDVSFPLLTRGVVDAVAESGFDANLLPWMLGYVLCTIGIALSITHDEVVDLIHALDKCPLPSNRRIRIKPHPSTDTRLLLSILPCKYHECLDTGSIADFLGNVIADSLHSAIALQCTT